VRFDFPIALTSIAFLMVLARILGFLAAAPVFGSNNVDARYRVAIAVCLTVVLMPLLPANWQPPAFAGSLTMLRLLMLIGAEIVLGMVVALIVLLIQEMLTFGGFLIDQNAGFAMAQTFDPTSGQSVTVFAALLGHLLIVIFLLSNAHHDLLRLIAASFESVPPGTFLIRNDTYQGLRQLSGELFVEGTRLALPFIAIILLINIALALATRFAQEFPVLMLMLPIRLGVSLFLLWIMVPALVATCRGVILTMFRWLFMLLGV